MIVHPRWIGGILAVGLTVLSSMVNPAASATPADDKRVEAGRIAAQRQQLVQTAERLNEESKAAADLLTGLNAELATTGNELADRDASLSRMNTEMASFALKSYLFGAGTGVLDVVSGIDSVNDTAVKEGYSAVLLGSTGDAADIVRAARQDITRIVKDLAAKQQRQVQLSQRISTNQATVAATQTKLDDLAKHLDAELATLVEEEAAKQDQERMVKERLATERAAAAAAATKAASAKVVAVKAAQTVTPVQDRPATNEATSTTRPVAKPTAVATAPTAKPAVSAAPTTVKTATPDRPGPTTSPPTSRPATTKPTTLPVTVPDYPAPSAGAATAIAEAKRQLGKPYVFGTNGPNTFDCSGLTQWAWAKAGVSMSHYTVSQFNELPHVPVGALQPGDLVFFKIDLGHMGMYIGGGMVIHAPQTGDVVKISPLSNFNVVGAARPG